MANERSKRKLSSKQAINISVLISTIYMICVLAIGLVSKLTGDSAALYYFIICVGGGLFIYFGLCFVIFRVDDKIKEEREEREKKMENAILQYLSYTDFRQVYLLKNSDMLLQIMEKQGCKFYAKLENKNIHLIAKNKHDEDVLNIEKEERSHFHSNFEFEEPKL